MGRPKGSKNKSKVVAIAQPVVIPVVVQPKWLPGHSHTYTEPCNKCKEFMAQEEARLKPPPPPPVYKPKLGRPSNADLLARKEAAELANSLDLIYKSLAKEVERMRAHFRATDYILPDRLVAKMDAVLLAPNARAGQELATKAENSIHLNFCYEWAKGRIPGALNVYNVENQAKKAENLAIFLEKQGKHENAEKQRLRAAEIRESLSTELT